MTTEHNAYPSTHTLNEMRALISNHRAVVTRRNEGLEWISTDDREAAEKAIFSARRQVDQMEILQCNRPKKLSMRVALPGRIPRARMPGHGRGRASKKGAAWWFERNPRRCALCWKDQDAHMRAGLGLARPVHRGGRPACVARAVRTDASDCFYLDYTNHPQSGNRRRADAGRVLRRLAASLGIRCRQRNSHWMDHESGTIQSD